MAVAETTETTEPDTTTETTTTSETNTTTETTTPSETTTTTQTPSVTLAEVLARTAEIVSVKYDTLVTRPRTPASTMTTWVKRNRMRMETVEQGEAVVILVDDDTQTVYRYVPAQNTATQTPYPPPTKTAMKDAESITDYNPSVVGTETMDGKVCLVVEYLESGAPTKMWLWQDYGLPLRVERTVPVGIVVVKSSNIDFADIPDSLFELPPGVHIIR
jgi:outer membrane lipoprotein-sorting protein